MALLHVVKIENYYKNC